MTPTLAQALSHIAPQYNAAQHKRAAERMVQDMEKIDFSITECEEDDAGFARFTVNTNCKFHDESTKWETLASAIEAAPDLLAALEALVDALDADICSANILDMIDGEARAAIARAKGGGQ